MIRTPQFWLKKNLISFLLLPFSLIYAFFSGLKNLLQVSHKISKPTICIGNITVGGSGKTPVALAIGKILHELDIDFVYLSRGYKAKKVKFGFVDLQNSKAEEVGDEPLLLEEVAPTFVAKNRVEGAKKIDHMSHVEAVIIDDGMQNNSLKKDILFLVIDGKIQFGNEFLFPAGLLRQSIRSGLKQADYVVVIGEMDQKLENILKDKKVIRAKIKAKNLQDFAGQDCFAFAGIAMPQKFFSYLEEQGLHVVETRGFPDHYFYSKSQLNNFIEDAKTLELKLITTKKDWVKFDDESKKKISYLDIDLELENKEQLKVELKKILIKE